MRRSGRLERRTPLRRTRRRPRAAFTGCQVPGCRRVMFRLLDVRRCATHAADKLTGDAVRARDRVCLRCGCGGPLDWAHIVRRSRSAALRWSIADTHDGPANNAIALCRRCHEWLDTHPELGRDFMASLNIDVRALERLAEVLPRPDPREVVMRLETAA